MDGFLNGLAQHKQSFKIFRLDSRQIMLYAT